nr:unnamed protein product [Digitaria exilis]
MWGAAGGAAFHFARGLRGAPSGSGARLALAGAVRAASANAPRVGGTFAAYCAALSAIETAVSHARDSVDMWCSVSASAALWGLHGMRRGGAVAAARGALLGTTGGLAIYGTHHASMVRASRQADADSLLRQKRMMARGQPTPVAIAASRTAAAPPIDGPTSAAILYGNSRRAVAAVDLPPRLPFDAETSSPALEKLGYYCDFEDSDTLIRSNPKLTRWLCWMKTGRMSYLRYEQIADLIGDADNTLCVVSLHTARRLASATSPAASSKRDALAAPAPSQPQPSPAPPLLPAGASPSAFDRAPCCPAHRPHCLLRRPEHGRASTVTWEEALELYEDMVIGHYLPRLPRKEELKTVVDKVKGFFGNVTAGAKESFAQITGSAVRKRKREQKAKSRSSVQRDKEAQVKGGPQRGLGLRWLTVVHKPWRLLGSSSSAFPSSLLVLFLLVVGVDVVVLGSAAWSSSTSWTAKLRFRSASALYTAPLLSASLRGAAAPSSGLASRRRHPGRLLSKGRLAGRLGRRHRSAARLDDALLSS